MKLQSKIGFFALVALLLALGVIGYYFFSASNQRRSDFSLLSQTEGHNPASIKSEEISADNSSPKSASVKLFSSNNESVINIGNGEEFLLSTEFKLFGLGGNNTRHILMHRYREDHVPYFGWAIAVKISNGKFRPQLYYRNHRGNGGWFSFKEVVFKEGDKYRLFVGVNPAQFATAYLSRISEANAGGGNRVEFIGGVDLTDINLVNQKGELVVNRVTSEQDGAHAEVLSFLIGTSNFIQSDRQQILKKIADETPIEDVFGLTKVIVSGRVNE